MHGHGMGQHWGFYRRGPSRLLWFLIGAGATAFWMKKREGHYGICGPRPIEAAPPTENGYAHHHQWQWPPRRPEAVPPSPAIPAQSPVEKAPVDFIPPPQAQPQAQIQTHPSPQPKVDAYWGWDAERENIEKMSRQATDAMAELTESTLESVLATAETLKAKLAEHRAQREKEQQKIQSQLEEQRKNPPRLV